MLVANNISPLDKVHNAHTKMPNQIIHGVPDTTYSACYHVIRIIIMILLVIHTVYTAVSTG